MRASILYDLFKTALLQKNGFCKIYWNPSKEQRKEQYQDLTENEYNSLLLDTEVEIVNVEEKASDDALFPVKYDVEIKRISKPGRRVYSRATSIPKVLNGLGLAILSTSKGVMSDVEATKNNLGGEIICRIF